MSADPPAAALKKRKKKPKSGGGGGGGGDNPSPNAKGGGRCVVVVVDGGYWHQACGDPSSTLRADLCQLHLATIQRAAGGLPLAHVTFIDSDPHEALIETASEGMTSAAQLAELAASQQRRADFYDLMVARLGANVADTSHCKMKFQKYRRMVPAFRTGGLGEARWEYSKGLTTSGCDVGISMRLMEYGHGLYTTPNGQTLRPTAVVLLSSDPDVQPALASLNAHCPSVSLFLADFHDVQGDSSRPVELMPYIRPGNVVSLKLPGVRTAVVAAAAAAAAAAAKPAEKAGKKRPSAAADAGADAPAAKKAKVSSAGDGGGAVAGSSGVKDEEGAAPGQDDHLDELEKLKKKKKWAKFEEKKKLKAAKKAAEAAATQGESSSKAAPATDAAVPAEAAAAAAQADIPSDDSSEGVRIPASVSKSKPKKRKRACSSSSEGLINVHLPR